MTGAGRVKVYWLASPSHLAEAEAAIRTALFGVLGVADQGRHKLDVSPTSGIVRYTDTAQLWREDASPALPPTSAQARKAAEKFLKDAGAAIDKLRPTLSQELERVIVVPPLDPREIATVMRPDARGWDHWLYRAQPTLPAGGDNRRLPVDGATFDVRIGGGGAVISFTFGWRPILADSFQTTVSAPPAAGAGGHGGHGEAHDDDHHGEHPAPPILAYVWDGDAAPQYYLAPYYLIPSDHDMNVASATPYSLVADFAWRDQEDDETEVAVMVEGGSGQYDFGFASYASDDLWDGALVIHDGSSRPMRTTAGEERDVGRVRIPRGARVLLVNIRDRRTGAFRHAAHLVVANPVLRKTGERPAPVVA
jgi:hypothetical protein